MATCLDLVRDHAGIASMTAALEQSSIGMPPVDEFRVPKTRFASVLSALESANPDDSPAKWETFGRLEFVSKNGARKSILLYLTGSSPNSEIAFKCGGKKDYYRGGSAQELEQAIRTAAAESGN